MGLRGLRRGRVPLSVSHQVSGEKKPVGSTEGMQTSVETSPLLKVWGNTGLVLPGLGEGPRSLGMGLEGVE